MHSLLITITTTQRSTDLVVPAEIPIRDIVPALLDVCGSQPLTAPPEKWHLQLADATMPLDGTHSLLEVGVTDGAILVLQDMTTVEPPLPQQQQKEEQFAPECISPSEETGGIGIYWGTKH
jgi:hypothetical protein